MYNINEIVDFNIKMKNIDTSKHIQTLTNYQKELKILKTKLIEIELKKNKTRIKRQFNENLHFLDTNIKYEEIVKKIKIEPIICSKSDCLNNVLKNNSLCSKHSKKICTTENCNEIVYKNSKCKIHMKKLCSFKKCGRIVIEDNMCKIHNPKFKNICIVRNCTRGKEKKSDKCTFHNKKKN